MKLPIRNARLEDSRKIAEAIIMAIGNDLAMELANGHGLTAVINVFETLAKSEDSQYSYRNAFVAESDKGDVAGIVVAYDGSILLESRRLFFALAKDYLGWDIRDIVEDGEPPVETDPSEYYLDSLAVWPEYRNKGVASLLIKKIEEEAKRSGKPIGLLCANHNENAKSLYEHLGFKKVGERPFAGEMMMHMQK